MTDARDVIAEYMTHGLGFSSGGALADGIIRALRDAGLAVVPREPTEEMYRAALTVTRDEDYGHVADVTGGAVWRAMLAAASPSPVSPSPGKE